MFVAEQIVQICLGELIYMWFEALSDLFARKQRVHYLQCLHLRDNIIFCTFCPPFFLIFHLVWSRALLCSVIVTWWIFLSDHHRDRRQPVSRLSISLFWQITSSSSCSRAMHTALITVCCRAICSLVVQFLEAASQNMDRDKLERLLLRRPTIISHLDS